MHYLAEHGIIIIETGNSQTAMMQKYERLLMTWIDFKCGGEGVCCIGYQDLHTLLYPCKSENGEEPEYK